MPSILLNKLVKNNQLNSFELTKLICHDEAAEKKGCVVTLGDRVKQAREAKGWSQRVLAHKIGMSQQSVAAIEKERSERPRKLDTIAKVLGVSEEWLQFGTGNLRENEVSLLPASERKEAKTYRAPHFSWTDSRRARQVFKSEDLSDYELIDSPVPCNKTSFVLTIKDTSMVSDSPYLKSYLPNEKIICDTALDPVDGDLVIASLPDAPEGILRQYVVVGGEGGRASLVPLNRQYETIKVTEGVEVQGVVVGGFWESPRRKKAAE